MRGESRVPSRGGAPRAPQRRATPRDPGSCGARSCSCWYISWARGRAVVVLEPGLVQETIAVGLRREGADPRVVLLQRQHALARAIAISLRRQRSRAGINRAAGGHVLLAVQYPRRGSACTCASGRCRAASCCRTRAGGSGSVSSPTSSPRQSRLNSSLSSGRKALRPLVDQHPVFVGVDAGDVGEGPCRCRNR